MRRRRRYEVVVEGLSGQAAAQRSVISEHRTEAAARQDAVTERNRLEVIYGEGAGAWRVVVIHDDRVVWEERPASLVTPPIERFGTDEEPLHPDPGEAPAAAPPREEAPSGPVPDWVIQKVEESLARRDERRRREGEGG